MPMRPPRDAARLQQQMMLGARMRKVREELAWSQGKAAEAIGFASPSAISAIERGLNGIDAIDLYNYARATGYPVAYFLDPNFAERAPAWPKTRMEWINLAGGDIARGDAHWAIEQVLSAATS